MSLVQVKDTLSPDLLRRARAAGDKRPLLTAMGTAFQGVAQQAFTDPSARAHKWDERKDKTKTHPLLMESGTLETSLRIQVEGSRVVIESDRPYAAVHQLGSDKQNIPARPFMPFHKSGKITDLGKRRVENALKAALRVQGL